MPANGLKLPSPSPDGPTGSPSTGLHASPVPRPTEVEPIVPQWLTRLGRRLRAMLASRRGKLLLVATALGGLLAVLAVAELETSWSQARVFAALSRAMTFSLSHETAATIASPPGPYDQRLGYTRLPAFTSRLASRGYVVAGEAHVSLHFQEATDWGLFPIFREKTQAGLRVVDRDGRALYQARVPEHAYPQFDAIPPLVVETLLLIENQSLLNTVRPYDNPAVEWDRLVRAGISFGIHALDPDSPRVGGSTLATQLEKIRHSPNGVTTSAREKLRQIVSASARAYRDGEETFEARQRIVVDYVNSMPLAAIPGSGEVIGLLDGLWAWYGSDLQRVNALLAADATALRGEELVEQGRAYRQVLSLLLALRRPTHYLVADQPGLAALTDRYLSVLRDRAVITDALYRQALEQRLVLRRRAPDRSSVSFVDRKAVNAIRMPLVTLLDTKGTYDLDRLDLTVRTTLDHGVQAEVTEVVERLGSAADAADAGLYGRQLLGSDQEGAVTYSVALYERDAGVNRLRLIADNHNQPLSIHEGTKLEFGSTAKLRTLVTYLEIVADLHRHYASCAPQELAEVRTHPRDRMTAWALRYLAAHPQVSLTEMLEAALDRRYSASPAETFWTGGAPHTFANFDADDNARVVTVREAFRRSVNLVFIRLLRDIVHSYMAGEIGPDDTLLSDRTHPARATYLARFADREGRVFLRRFWEAYRGHGADAVVAEALSRARRSPEPLAAVHRFVWPDADIASLTRWLTDQLAEAAASGDQAATLYDRYAPTRYPLADRAHLVRLHPLELWLVSYLVRHPEPTWDEIDHASTEARQAAYRWLFRTRNKGPQDRRIRTMLEIDAFKPLHQAWARMGCPFDSLVPSYATAIGSSGDTPAALAELMGIILNDGLRLPTTRIEELRFAEGTPYETWFARKPPGAVRVLDAAVAAVLRARLRDVVEHGTGRRAHNAVVLADGTPLVIGGKTGTGDNRVEPFGTHAAGQSRVRNRTATFVFFIGDRFYGTITAHVGGRAAREYHFTSALPVQLFTQLVPFMRPIFERPGDPCLVGQTVVPQGAHSIREDCGELSAPFERID